MDIEIADGRIAGIVASDRPAPPASDTQREPALAADRVIEGGGLLAIPGLVNAYLQPRGYSSSKWAVRGLTRTIALELGKYDITVNDVCPNVTNGARMERNRGREGTPDREDS